MLLYLPTACIVGFHSRDLQKLTMITNATVQIIYSLKVGHLEKRTVTMIVT